MLGYITKSFDYLTYLFESDNLHAIHSPFVFNWAENVLYHNLDKRNEYIEFQRTLMLKSSGKMFEYSISKFTDKYTLPAKYAFVLQRMMSYFEVSSLYEYGLCNGIETNYACVDLKRPIQYKYVYDQQNLVKEKTNEGLSDFLKLEPESDFLQSWEIHLVHLNARGKNIWDFFDHIHANLKLNSIVIFTNIRCTDEQFIGWRQIANDSKVTIDIDIFRMGILFFRKEQPKESFLLRY